VSSAVGITKSSGRSSCSGVFHWTSGNLSLSSTKSATDAAVRDLEHEAMSFSRETRRDAEAEGCYGVVLQDGDAESWQMVLFHQSLDVFSEGGGGEEVHS
jgi:hypothetical protein